jgi:hypothetical protein
LIAVHIAFSSGHAAAGGAATPMLAAAIADTTNAFPTFRIVVSRLASAGRRPA